LIDTSTNYTDGASERLVGALLAEMARRDPAARRQVTLVSKIGYVQGANLELAMEREAAGRPFPEMVHYMDGCWHCVHPEFLADQLTRSLERLRVDRLDLCLLHNSEYFLSDAAHHRVGVAEARAEFDRRITAAFAHFEAEVRAGRIGAYGVSSNSAVVPPDDPEATSVSRFLAAAEAAGGAGHHFKVLQLPMNLFESGAALEKNTGPDGGSTALEAAAAAGLAVLATRPHNAILGGRLLRLADGQPATAAVSAAIDRLLPEERRGATLSQKAIAVVASTPGMNAVLVGMRREAYVDDALPVGGWPALPDPIGILRRCQALLEG
ncbi:MAG TPA: aldo/keto reductase, partial [Dongiaceae bacterium]|nr:aldo/keto reductase [Dongiaceae bacterium]